MKTLRYFDNFHLTRKTRENITLQFFVNSHLSRKTAKIAKTQPGFSNEFIFCTKWEFYCNSSCREMGSIWMIGSRKEADLGKFSYPHFFSYSRFSTLALRDAIIDRHGGQQGVAYSPVHTKSWKEGGCKGLSYLSINRREWDQKRQYNDKNTPKNHVMNS